MREKTIADKMYLKSAKSLAVFNGAVHPAIVEQLPRDLLDAGESSAEVVLVFALSQAELAAFLPDALARLGDKGSLWIAYLKQSAPKATDLTRENIDATLKEHGATSVALISVDADWSGLRFKVL